jgi:NADH:ubiquinone oxidoreductase subunit 5 (subunit L)/multisubunit Na+/H+ antiporter MnhA subunit
MGIMLDPISVMMLVVVTFVSLMVHLFSLGYMKGEERFATYYAFLGLFTFSMLGLVVSSNLFQIYMFWELVGASSYSSVIIFRNHLQWLHPKKHSLLHALPILVFSSAF